MESIAKTLPAPHNLTQRECDIISMLGEGLSSKMIADRLNISKHTVDTHRRNILRKLDAGNTAGILEEAQKLRII